MGFVGSAMFIAILFVVSAVMIAFGFYFLLNDKYLKGVFSLIGGFVLMLGGFIVLENYDEDAIREIPADYVQIDTVYTICNEKIDTTYIIHYR